MDFENPPADDPIESYSETFAMPPQPAPQPARSGFAPAATDPQQPLTWSPRRAMEPFSGPETAPTSGVWIAVGVVGLVAIVGAGAWYVMRRPKRRWKARR